MAQEPARGRFIEYVDGELADDSEIPMSDEEKAFSDFRNSLEAGDEVATLIVHKVPTSKNGPAAQTKSIYCFHCPIDRYEYNELMQVIRDTYGGGVYRLMCSKKGKRGLAFNRLVEIAEPIKPDFETGSNEKYNPVGGQFDAIGNMLLKMQERTEEMLSRMTPQNQASDPFNSMERIIGILAGLNGLLPQQKQSGDVLSEMERFAKFREIGQSLFGGSDGNSEKGFYDLATESIRALSPVISQVAQGSQPKVTPAIPWQQPASTEQHSTPNPQPSSTPNSAPVDNGAINVNAEKERQIMAQQIGILITNAKRGISPEAMAETVVNMTPDNQLEKLHTFISAPDCLQRMIALNPEVRDFEQWFTSLRDSILAEISVDDSPLPNDHDSNTLTLSEATGAHGADDSNSGNANNGGT